MTVSIPPELEQALRECAREANLSVPDLVESVLRRYLGINPMLRDELEAWQEIRDEAIREH